MASAISTATSGLQAASLRFDQAASQLARAGTNLAGAGDPAAAIEDVITAQTSFQVNISVIRSAADAEKHLLDILL